MNNTNKITRSRLNSFAWITKTKTMKKHNNTTLICLTLGLFTGSLLASLMIGPGWFVLSVILFLALGIFYTSHGEEKVWYAKGPRAKNTLKKM